MHLPLDSSTLLHRALVVKLKKQSMTLMRAQVPVDTLMERGSTTAEQWFAAEVAPKVQHNAGMQAQLLLRIEFRTTL